MLQMESDMPVVEISGISNKRQRKIIELAVGFYCKLLMRPSMVAQMSFNIVIKKKLESDAVGYCEVTGYNKAGAPRDFDIQLYRSGKFEDLLRYLAHEVVHAKQYAKKELSETTDCWMKKRVSSNTNYWDHPWEIEAYGRELGMLIRFAEFYNLAQEVFGKEESKQSR